MKGARSSSSAEGGTSYIWEELGGGGEETSQLVPIYHTRGRTRECRHFWSVESESDTDL